MTKRLALTGIAFCLAGLPFMSATAQNWTATKLNTFAKTNETTGAIIVLGTPGAWGGGTSTKEMIYDGNTATFFDSTTAQGAWAGFELQTPKVVTRISYMGRAGLAGRMNGALFQGANTADFSDAVTLYAHVAPANWNGTDWINVTPNTTAALRTYTFLRFLSAAPESYGNAGEVEFYGTDPLATVPPTPVMAFADSANWYAHLRWTVAADAMAYEVQRKRANETDYATIMTDFFKNTGTYTWRDPQTLYNDAQYRIRARNNFGDSDWYAFTAVARYAATGTLFGVPGSYSNDAMTYDKFYDANIDTFFDGPNSSGGNNLWGAIDLGTPRPVTGVRFTPRSIFPDRMVGGQFQAADNADFAGAVTLYTVPSTPSVNSMTEFVLATPVTQRYVRYLSPNGGWGNAAEIEFDLAPAAPKAPIGLAFTHSDITNDYPVLTWSFDTFNLVTSSHVYRATAPGGPYTVLTPAGVFGRTFTDTNLTAGILYYYKVGALYTDGSTFLEGPLSAHATYRRSERIERSWTDNTALKAGMTAFYADSNVSWTPASYLFDGNLDTFGDAGPANCKVGVDLGKPYVITSIRFSPRANIVFRSDGAVLRGSNDGSLAAPATLATFVNPVANAYTILPTIDAVTAYRYVFATRLDGTDFYANLSELELYGWDPGIQANVLTAPLSLSSTMQTATVRLDWTAASNQTFYRVERMPADGSGSWTTVGTTNGLSLYDMAPAFGVRCLYRVASVRTTESGEEVAYSDTLSIIAYTIGSGTGLKGHYRHPYTKAYNPAEALILTQVDATIDFLWGDPIPIAPGFPQSSVNTRVTWYGKLLVPFTGDYTFHLTTDDGAALRLDGQFVINDWVDRYASTSTGTRNLTVGEHTIQVDFYQGGGGASARLEWDGAFGRAVIPASQLIPLDLPSDDIGAWHGRSFNTPKLGYHAYDAPSGGITVCSYGLDLEGGNEGHHFVWQPISGPFLLEAKVTQTIDPLTPAAKALLMVRNGVESGSAFLAPARAASGQLGYKARLTTGGPITDLLGWQGAPTNPCWMRIKRVGNTFTTQVRDAGGEWQTFQTFVDSANVFNATLYAGFSVTSPLSGTTVPLQSATFSDIRFTPLYGTMIIVQ